MSIKTVYFIHHSHTDIGYTELQEIILNRHVEYIRKAVALSKMPHNKDFRWNCETYFCVERFLKEATPCEKDDFFALVKNGRMGISGTYLNFSDLADTKILSKRLKEVSNLLKEHDIEFKTAMNADINGISMGQRDAMLDAGVEFLFTNIHTHHGMYPLWQNQNAYFWENKNGKRLLVWNGEHYNLGNFFGFSPTSTELYDNEPYPHVDVLSYYDKIAEYIEDCETNGYPYDFIISGISGIFSDNAPPNADILRLFDACNALDRGVSCKMVSLQELYEILKEKLPLSELPVYKGDLTDWWANGIGSSPYVAKHYRSALHMYHLAGKLWPDCYKEFPELTQSAEDNLLIYAEHTYGHSATISDPYETMVLDLDMRKSGYANKAHEASAMLLEKVKKHFNSRIVFYETSGVITSICTGNCSGNYLVEFYVEQCYGKQFRVINEATGIELEIQVSPHPRGSKISFVDTFMAGESKSYKYCEIAVAPVINTKRHVYVGAEQVRDIINSHDAETYKLNYEVENEWLKISYVVGKGFTSLYNKIEDREMLCGGLECFFTPLYERTEIRTNNYEERRILGRNIRGTHAELFQGKLVDVKCIEKGAVFLKMMFRFKLEGTQECILLLKVYRHLPRVDFTLRIAKDLSKSIESVYMPLSLDGIKSLYFNKGNEPFRPGVDQIPGSCMEYWISDRGAVCLYDKSSVILHTQEVPLFYMGDMCHHPIKLCDNKEENNVRPLYSWVMNNTWETNFKIDLSGFSEFTYRLELVNDVDTDSIFNKMESHQTGIFTYYK